MYIRIQDNKIRFRVSSQEAQQLISGENIRETIKLSQSFQLCYEVSSHDAESDVTFDDNNKLTLLINSKQLASEIKDRPSKTGIEITSPPPLSLKASLEVDLKRNNNRLTK